MQDKELKLEDLFSLCSSFLKKNLWFLIAFFILGVVVGVWQYKKALPSYETDYYGFSEFVPLDLIRNELYSIQSLIDERNIHELVVKTGLDSNTVTQIISLNYMKVSDSDRMFAIGINSEAEENLNHEFAKGVLYYLEENAFIKNYLKEKEEQLLFQNKVIAEELVKLENLQIRLLAEKNQGSSFSIISDPSVISNQIIELNNLIAMNNLKLENVTVFKLIDSIDVVRHPSFKKKVISAVIVMLFLGLMLILLGRMILGR